jgi:phosphoribosylaminoimidazole carboxylase PurE protein
MPKSVAVVMGSDSDLPVMEKALDVLDELGVPFEVHVASAHRTPERAVEVAQGARGRGVGVIISGAGGAAHLGGVLAAHTTLPVVGVPIETTPLRGFDALLATVQMPGGVPVASMAVGAAGAQNAALFACAILALGDEALAQRLEDYRRNMAKKVEERDAQVKSKRKSKAPLP